MVRTLLVRGMLVGIVAGMLSYGFLKIYGEPQVDRAISFETQMDEAKATADKAHGMATGMNMSDEEGPALVSRTVQAGLGLFTAIIVYSAAFGGLFGLAFAFASVRFPGALTPQSLSALLAATGFVAIYLVPNLKYPASPPAVGDPETIGVRTALYFIMIAAGLVLPTVNEVPDQFPAAVLWKFRIASLGAQVIMWTTLGLLFGALTQRALTMGRTRA